MVTSSVKQGDNHERFNEMWERLDKKRKDHFFQGILCGMIMKKVAQFGGMLLKIG